MPDVALSAADQRLLQEQPLHELQFNHWQDCPMTADIIVDAAGLILRFRLYLSINHVVVQTERGPVLVARLVPEKTAD